ncbi:metallophosphoesterase [Paracoccus beibuensis]|uniref:metallophosphoesterase n=1 Tax=Paracoccus beibuensis TaxID=547602 RepID=UPI00223F21FD|nr:metallophosphoesterase [Paracoccus beibuensis]
MKQNRRAEQFRSGAQSLSILVVPDTHFRPNESFDDTDRAGAVGRFALDKRPDVIIHMGDLVDMQSVSKWAGAKSVGGAGGSRSHERKRIREDLACFREMQRAMWAPIHRANERHINRSRHRERVYTPRGIQLLGNHCGWLDRVPENIPELDGLIGTFLLHEISEDNGLECYDFREVVTIGGIDFSHNFPTGNSRQPVGIAQALNKWGKSLVFAHTHTVGYDRKPVGKDGAMMAYMAGCFMPPHRCGPFEWSGLSLLTEVADGNALIQQFSYDQIMEGWGEGGYAQQLRQARAAGAQLRYDAERAFE